MEHVYQDRFLHSAEVVHNSPHGAQVLPTAEDRTHALMVPYLLGVSADPPRTLNQGLLMINIAIWPNDALVKGCLPGVRCNSCSPGGYRANTIVGCGSKPRPYKACDCTYVLGQASNEPVLIRPKQASSIASPARYHPPRDVASPGIALPLRTTPPAPAK